MTFDRFCHRIACLNVDKSGGVAKPYKPLLIAAFTLLIGKGEIRSRYILLDGALKSVFSQLLRRLFPDWPYRGDIRLPFRHLATDGVWKLIAAQGRREQLEARLAVQAKAPSILRHVAFAELDAEVFTELSTSIDARIRVFQTLCARYFPAGAFDVLAEGAVGTPPLPVIPETPIAFTERILEEYLWTNWRKTPFHDMGICLDDPGRHVMTPVNCIDLLGWREKQNPSWVFELKKGLPVDRVVGQLQRYMGWMEKANPGREVRGAVIAGDADEKLRCAVRVNSRVGLWLYNDRFEIQPDPETAYSRSR